MVLQPIHDIAEICARLGVREAVLSPGSRCAPLILSFARHPEITARSITDERSAGFIGFGIAQKTKRPVVNVCTSGTAVLNLAPALAEAFYQKVPMIIITADRPPEWIDQQDGQTIRQTNVFENHVKNSYQLPDHYSEPDVVLHINRIISEAVNLSKEYPAGPVHINVPLREPFYPEKNEILEYSKDLKVIQSTEPNYNLKDSTWNQLSQSWSENKRILLIVGQQPEPFGGKDVEDINEIAGKLPVVGDVISNIHAVENIISHPDTFLAAMNENSKALQPDLLITFGNSVISKNLKLFIRKFPPVEHWHIQPAGSAADTYQSLTKIVRTDIKTFFSKAAKWKLHPHNIEFRNSWYEAEDKAKKLVRDFTSEAGYGEFVAVARILNALPDTGNLHLANSMPVRLVNFVGLGSNHGNVRVVANRGTSGIDGSNGTAVGEALVSRDPVVLITGDLAFFYDRNAFWHNHDLSNLKIIMLNNHAGGIFGIIDGPSHLPELSTFFETDQKLTAKNTAHDYGFKYFHCSSRSELDDILPRFFETRKGPLLLEIETSNELNKTIFKEFKNRIIKEFKR